MVREADQYAREGDAELRQALHWQDRDPDTAARHVQNARYALAQIRVLMLELQRLDD